MAAASPLPGPRPGGIQRRWIVSHLVALWTIVLLELVIVGLLVALVILVS